MKQRPWRQSNAEQTALALPTSAHTRTVPFGAARPDLKAPVVPPAVGYPLPAVEVSLTDADLRRIAVLAHAHAGIVLTPNKKLMVQGRLQPLLRAHGCKSYGEYLNCLQEADAKQLQAFINALTTNLTAFFREGHHFPILAKHLLDPRLHHPHRVVWSAACSTGEEAYSIAMTLVESYGSFAPPVRVLATDIDTAVLKHAEQGVYPLTRLRDLSEQRLKRFFIVDEQAGSAAVRPELRSLIVFRQVNLLDAAWAMRPPIDAIFCRNVMIYFDKPTQERILSKFAPLMHPEGLLFVGHSENYTRSGDLFNSRGNTVYELSPHGKELAQRSRERWRPPPSAAGTVRPEAPARLSVTRKP